MPASTATLIPRRVRHPGCFNWDSDEQRYDSILSELSLSDIHKDSIRLRYFSLLYSVRRKCAIYSALFYIGHFIITVGSLTVPALLSIQYTSDDTVSSAHFQYRIYWATWALSLAVTMFNGILVLFKVDKKYYFLHTNLERLRSEGWQYFELTGRYTGVLSQYKEPPTHTNQFPFFCHYIEKIKLNQVEEEYYKYEESTEGVSTLTKNTVLYPPSIGADIGGKEPPQAVKDIIAGLVRPAAGLPRQGSGLPAPPAATTPRA